MSEILDIAIEPQVTQPESKARKAPVSPQNLFISSPDGANNYDPPISRKLMEGITGVSTNTLVKYEAEGIIKPQKVKHGGLEVVTYRIADVHAVLAKRGISFKKKKSAEVIAVFSQKGGVGKSICAQQLSAMLSLIGGKVLTVDLDSQGDVTNLLDAYTKYTDVVRNYDELDPTIADLMDWTLEKDENGEEQDSGYKKRDFSQVIKKVSPYLDVIPAGLDLGEINFSLNRLPLSKDRFFEDGALKDPPELYMVTDVIDQLRDKYDFIIFDCPPNIETLNVSALLAANRILIPLELEAKSLMTISRNELFLKRLMTYEKGFNWDKILVVPNKYKNENIKMKAYAALEDLYLNRTDVQMSEVLMPLSSIIDRCQEAREPVFVSATRYGKESRSAVKPAKEFTNYFWAIAHELLDIPLDRLIFSTDQSAEV